MTEDERMATAARFTSDEAAVIREAAQELDTMWDFDAARGKSDSRPGMEYERMSLAPQLRRMLGEGG